MHCRNENNMILTDGSLLPLLGSIDALLDLRSHAVIAVDGRCCSGKTTLSAALASRYGCDVVHMDDFFLPFSMRTKERLSQPGGNVHYERILEEVFPLLRSHKPGGYRVFSCSTGEYSPAGYLLGSPLTVVEGSYAMHPELSSYYDLSVFSDVSPKLQQKRLLQRNGAEALDIFLSKWIPLEEAYFSYYRIPEICDYIIRLTDNMVL